MGGRGASSGVSDKGRAYGTEYKTLLKVGNVKFVRYKDSKSAKTPMETMTKGRVYVTINDKDEPKAITYYDKRNRRYKQIDLSGTPHVVNGEKLDTPHAHLGYVHDEKGTRVPGKKERKMIDLALKAWYNRKRE